MSALLRNVTNCIWHAFDALQDSDLVHKSKLKVLTANIGTLLDLYGVEKGLDHYKQSTDLNFNDFKRYLHGEVFASLPTSLALPVLREYENKISEVCWLVCRKKLLNRDKPIFDEESVFKLFRIFCLLADIAQDTDDDTKLEVVLHHSEAGLVAEQLVQSLGLQWDAADWDAFASNLSYFKWVTFVAVLEAKYCGDGQIDKAAVVEAVDELYDVFIKDIIKKGYLLRKGYLLPTMREYWFVLQPCVLTYYKSSSEKYQCGKIALDQHCSVEPLGPEAGKLQRFTLNTPERSFDFATQDHKSRLQWVSALQLAVGIGAGAEGYQRGARARRRRADDRRDREAREARARLQHEVRARLAAEAHAQELRSIAKQENEKLEELKNAQIALEKLLQEEIQAKRDEEIVRALQARVLAEEWEKREELEKLQEEQNKLLEEERLKRQRFEILQAEKEAQYREAERRLKELEQERQRLDEELTLAQKIIKNTEKSAQTLEVQLRSIPVLRHDRSRKALTFIPTSKSSSDTLIDIRAASLTKHLNVVVDK